MYVNAQNKECDRSTIAIPHYKSRIIQREIKMLYTIAVVLLVLWLLGLVTSYTIGGFIHILLVIAVVVVLLRIISGRGLK
jgi:hypothetical protein